MSEIIKKTFLQAVRLERESVESFAAYPFSTEVKYTDTEHYQITKDFLNRYERILQLLLSAEDADLESKRRKN